MLTLVLARDRTRPAAAIGLSQRRILDAPDTGLIVRGSESCRTAAESSLISALSFLSGLELLAKNLDP